MDHLIFLTYVRFFGVQCLTNSLGRFQALRGLLCMTLALLERRFAFGSAEHRRSTQIINGRYNG